MSFPPIPGADIGRPPYGVKYGDQLPAYEYGLTGTTGITLLQAGIANRNNARLDIPVIGDSITEGRGATDFTERWVQQANLAMRLSLPTFNSFTTGQLGGLGFIPITNTGTITYTWPIVLASGSPSNIELVGPVRNAEAMVADCAYTFTAPTGTTSVKILHYDYGDFAEWSYQVNSGTVTTITQSTGDGELITATIPMSSGDVLTIAWVSGYAVVEGIVHYAGDENSGVTFHGCGHSGWQAGQATDTNAWNQTAPVPWQQSLANLITGAGAIGIFLGSNDATYYSATAFQANLETLIAFIQGGLGDTSLAAYPILLIIPYQVEDTFISGSWAPYATAIRNVQAATPNSHVIDLNYRMPPVASNFDGGALYADTFHPTDLGAALAGEIISACTGIA